MGYFKCGMRLAGCIYIRILGASILLLGQNAYAVTYTIHSLGDFVPYDINNNGQIVGTSSWFGGHAALYDGGHVTPLGTFGGTSGRALGINETGDIVGYEFNGSGSERAFLYTGGNMLNLGTLGGPNSRAVSINEYGQVVGSAADSSGVQRAFLYQNESMINIGPSGSTQSHAWDINDHGQVVGSFSSPSNQGGFLYQNGDIAFLPSLGYGSIPSQINNHGQIAAYTRDDSLSYLTMIENGTVDVITGMGEGLNIYGMSESGTMVGQGSDFHEQWAVIYTKNGWSPVNWAVGEPGYMWEFLAFTGINDRGDIVGWGLNYSSGTAQTQGFLLQAVPVPAAIWLLGSGFVGLLAVTKRRNSNVTES